MDKKSYCLNCNKWRKFKNPKKSYLFHKTFVHSVICGKFDSKDKKIFTGKQWSEILKIVALINNMEKHQTNTYLF